MWPLARFLRSLREFAALPALPVLFPISASADVTGDLLPSWNDTASKKAIVAFVERVTKQGSPDLVPEDEICQPLKHRCAIIAAATKEFVSLVEWI